MKLNDIKFITTIILLGLSLTTALVFESKMHSGYALELAIILIGIILMAGAIFGLWIEAEWAYPFTMLIFALSLINLIWLFTATNAFLAFAFGLIVNIAGLVICISSAGDASLEELETYEIDRKKKNKPV